MESWIASRSGLCYESIIMSLDPLEKERLRRKMATRMSMFLESMVTVSCVSAHVLDENGYCDLCQGTHATDMLVIKNRSGKTMRAALACLKEMVRFQVVDIEELPRWIEKLKELRGDAERRKMESELARREERKRLEKKVIVRKRNNQQNL